jgi:hypothetical protein
LHSKMHFNSLIIKQYILELNIDINFILISFCVKIQNYYIFFFSFFIKVLNELILS